LQHVAIAVNAVKIKRLAEMLEQLQIISSFAAPHIGGVNLRQRLQRNLKIAYWGRNLSAGGRRNVVQGKGFEKIENVVAVAAQQKFAAENERKKRAPVTVKHEAGKSDAPIAQVEPEAQFQHQKRNRARVAAETQQAVATAHVLPEHQRCRHAGFAEQQQTSELERPPKAVCKKAQHGDKLNRVCEYDDKLLKFQAQRRDTNFIA
jgi:hypothetical protein